MTTSKRFGLTALFVLGGVAMGTTFVGCGDDDPESTPPADTGTPPVDSGIDTGIDTGTPADVTDTPVDTGPLPPVAKVTVMFGAPDLPPQFICMGAFSPDPTTGLPKAGTDPISAFGPYGIPATGTSKNPSDWTDADILKLSGFYFGSYMPLVVSPATFAVMESLPIIAWIVEINPAVASADAGVVDKDACKKSWTSIKDKTERQLVIGKGSIKKGESWGAFIGGCAGGPTLTGECGTVGKNLGFKLLKLDVSTPDTKLGIQAANLSQFPGATAGYPPSWADVDLYIQPMNAPVAGDAGVDGGDGAAPSPTPAGTMIAIGGDKAGTGLKTMELAAAAKALDKIPGDPLEAILIVTKHGADPCVGTPLSTPACTTSVPIPLKAFLGGAMAADPTVKFDVGPKLIIALAGGPGDPAKTLRVMIANAKF